MNNAFSSDADNDDWLHDSNETIDIVTWKKNIQRNTGSKHMCYAQTNAWYPLSDDNRNKKNLICCARLCGPSVPRRTRQRSLCRCTGESSEAEGGVPLSEQRLHDHKGHALGSLGASKNSKQMAKSVLVMPSLPFLMSKLFWKQFEFFFHYFNLIVGNLL